MDAEKQMLHTVQEIYMLPDGKRAELIDGIIYNMAPPNRIHQELVHQLSWMIETFIRFHNGTCKVYPAPFAVYLNNNRYTYVEPDVSVICDRNKLDEDGCKGAPDWVIEVVSKSSQKMDYLTKLFKYRSAGVREYWIVNPMKESVMVYEFGEEEKAALYSFDEPIQSGIYPELKITISDLIG